MTLAEAKKAVIALVVGAIGLIGYFVAFDPTFEQAAVLVVSQAFGVIGVFAAKNATPDDYEKALKAFAGATLSAIGLFVTVDPNTGQVVAAAILLGVQVLGVLKTTNATPVG